MTQQRSAAQSTVSYRTVRIPQHRILTERRPDGTLILRSSKPPPDIAQFSFADFIPQWARLRGDAPAFCERDATGAWRRLNWRELWRQVQAVGAALLEHGFGQTRPLMLLSGNSVEQAVLLLACEYAGIPVAPVSPSYSLLSKDFVRLHGVAELVPPAAVFVQDASAFAKALDVLRLGERSTVIAVHNAQPGQWSWADLITTELTPARQDTVETAHAAIRSEYTARVLFTSGSTGVPKGVNLTYGNFKAVAAYYADNLAFLLGEQPVFLDWLPWYHGLGGVLNFGRSVQFGATHYIDDGRPMPGLIEKTVRNLREVAPTIFTTVPSAWAILAAELERDEALARNLFSKAHFFGYGGASLPQSVWERIQAVAERTIGERIVFCTGLASTETCGMGTYCSQPGNTSGNIGMPVPGSKVKLIPLESGDGRYEIRMRGANIFAGYIKHPELTAAAFDEEGFFRLGDAVRLADPADVTRGLLFAGRVVEDFKLTNGTWVRTGGVRLTLLDLCAPLLTDAVICGHDNSYIAALAWPNVAACQQLAPELSGLDAAALSQHPTVVAALCERLRAQRPGGASLHIERLMLMAEPPSADANEIADKGYVNQAATRNRRAHLVDELYRESPAAHIASFR